MGNRSAAMSSSAWRLAKRNSIFELALKTEKPLVVQYIGAGWGTSSHILSKVHVKSDT
jgi:hypothetical protein